MLPRRFLVCGLAVLGVLGCSGKNPITGSGTVVYRVTGSGLHADLTYSVPPDATSQLSNVALPWTANFPAHSGDFLYISAQNTGSAGCVHVEIVSGSKTLNDATSCGAFVIATASATY